MYKHTFYYFLGNKKYPEIYILSSYLIDNDMAIGTFGLRNRDPVLEMGILAMQNRDQLTIRDQSLEIDTELIRTLGKKKGDQ